MLWYLCLCLCLAVSIVETLEGKIGIPLFVPLSEREVGGEVGREENARCSQPWVLASVMTFECNDFDDCFL